MAEPDRQMIAHVMLRARGFSTAAALALLEFCFTHTIVLQISFLLTFDLLPLLDRSLERPAEEVEFRWGSE